MGKILLGGFWENSEGNKDFVAVCYNINGSLDNTFNINGIKSFDHRTYDDVNSSIPIQRDGKIFAICYASNGLNNAFAIGTNNVDGSTDNTFDSDEKNDVHYF